MKACTASLGASFEWIIPSFKRFSYKIPSFNYEILILTSLTFDTLNNGGLAFLQSFPLLPAVQKFYNNGVKSASKFQNTQWPNSTYKKQLLCTSLFGDQNKNQVIESVIIVQ